MSRYKISSQKPSRDELEKIAKEIVIVVKNEGADPYDEIHSTGLSMPLKETLLKKFNIAQMLHDFMGHKGDPHMRDVDCPPLRIEKLRDGDNDMTVMEGSKPLSGPGMSGTIRVKKIVSVPTKSMASDMRDMAKVDVSEDLPPEPIRKIAEEFRPLEKSPFDLPDYTDLQLISGIKTAEEELKVKAHTYKGFIEKMASDLSFRSDTTGRELKRVYGDHKVARNILDLMGGMDDVEVDPSPWKVSQCKEASEIVEFGEELLLQVKESHESVEFLKAALNKREEDYE